MKSFKFLFLTLLMSFMTLPLFAENNGLNNKFVKESAQAVIFLPESSSSGIVGVYLNVSSNDFSIYAAKNDGSIVFNHSAQKSFIKANKSNSNLYTISCKNDNIAKKDWFFIEIIYFSESDNILIRVFQDFRYNRFNTIKEYYCDAMAFHTGGYYGLQNPKYDSNLKKSFKFFDTFIESKFKKYN